MHPQLERVSETFSPQALDKARSSTWKAVHAIAAEMQVGMLETTAHTIATEILKSMGVTRFWHKTHVRFGVNTRQSFAEASLPGVRLQPNDIFFLDLGPVFEGYEGDCGATFVVGKDSEMQRAASDSKVIYDLIRARWLERGESGVDLYTFAKATAAERGWEFYLAGSSGHRISDFPHRLYHTGSLDSFEDTPAADRWVLEVHLLHPKRRFGAFYEDLLVR